MSEESTNEKLSRESEQLVKTMRDFSLSDFLGVARIVGAEEQENFEDYLTNIVIEFEKLPKKKQKQLVKMCKDVAKANKELMRSKDNENKTNEETEDKTNEETENKTNDKTDNETSCETK